MAPLAGSRCDGGFCELPQLGPVRLHSAHRTLSGDGRPGALFAKHLEALASRGQGGQGAFVQPSSAGDLARAAASVAAAQECLPLSGPDCAHQVSLIDGCLSVALGPTADGVTTQLPKIPLILAHVAYAPCPADGSSGAADGESTKRFVMAVVPRGAGSSEVGSDAHEGGSRPIWLLHLSGGTSVLQCALQRLSSCGAVRSDLETLYTVCETEQAQLGMGASATVFRACKRGSPADTVYAGRMGTVAVKMVRCEKASRWTSVEREVSALVAAQRHENIIGFKGLFQCVDPSDSGSTPRCAMVLQYCPGADLCQIVLRSSPWPEPCAAQALHGMFRGLEHLAQLEIVHRDVKPNNVLVSAEGNAVLCDFGLSAFLYDGKEMAKRCGSPGYAAPELLKGMEYDAKVDVFGAGATLYFIFAGHGPFFGRTTRSMLERNMKGVLSLQWRIDMARLSATGQDFLERVLHHDPDRRPTAAAALEHPWFTPDALQRREHGPEQKQGSLRALEIKSFHDSLTELGVDTEAANDKRSICNLGYVRSLSTTAAASWAMIGAAGNKDRKCSISSGRSMSTDADSSATMPYTSVASAAGNKLRKCSSIDSVPSVSTEADSSATVAYASVAAAAGNKVGKCSSINSVPSVSTDAASSASWRGDKMKMKWLRMPFAGGRRRAKVVGLPASAAASQDLGGRRASYSVAERSGSSDHEGIAGTVGRMDHLGVLASPRAFTSVVTSAPADSLTRQSSLRRTSPQDGGRCSTWPKAKPAHVGRAVGGGQAPSKGISGRISGKGLAAFLGLRGGPALARGGHG